MAPQTEDCPCCGKNGLVKDGICVTCGWGNIPHDEVQQFLYFNLKPALEKLPEDDPLRLELLPLTLRYCGGA